MGSLGAVDPRIDIGCGVAEGHGGNVMQAWTAIVTVASLVFYVSTILQVGAARGRHGVAAPAMTGHPEFERLVRVQANTIEGLVVYLPCLWLFSAYVDARLGAGLGVVWIVGRLIYARAYARDPGLLPN